MKNQFITYELALKLKELGFSEDCLMTYYHGQDKLYIGHPCDLKDIPAPLWQQAFDWFRERHNLHYEIFNSPIHVHGWKFRVYNLNGRLRNNNISQSFNEYQEAKQACLEKLIETVKLTL